VLHASFSLIIMYLYAFEQTNIRRYCSYVTSMTYII